MKKRVCEGGPTKSSSSIPNSFPSNRRPVKSRLDRTIHTDFRRLRTPVWWNKPPAERHPTRCCATDTTTSTNWRGTTLPKRNFLHRFTPFRTSWPTVGRNETMSGQESANTAHDDMRAVRVWSDQLQSSTSGYWMQVLMMVTMITKLSLTETTVLSPPPLALTSSSHSP